jgi:hypothetical protein
VLVVGNGPGLVVGAALLHARGARLVAILEAAATPRLTARERAWLRRAGAPYSTAHSIIGATGRDNVERVETAAIDRDGVVRAGSRTTAKVDAIVTAFGRLASSELARLAGCRHAWVEPAGHVPERDAWLRTTVPGISVSGDAAGPSQPGAAVAEGQLGAIGAALALGRLQPTEAERRAAPLRRRLARIRRVEDLRAGAFRVGPAFLRLNHPDAVLCPCEDVTVAQVRASLADPLAGDLIDPNVVKVRTRAGMGTCQGRRCGEHLTRLVAEHAGRRIEDIEPLSVRPPIVPIPIEAFRP